jgi:transposase InsO family protein
MVKRSKAKGRGGKVKPRTRPYPYEFRLKMVRLFLEEGYSTSILRESFGVSHHSVHRWARAYREQGPEGLLAKQHPGAKPKISSAVKKRIVKVKKKHPEYGARRIADVLKRIFLMSASASSVHKTLSDAGMTEKAKPKPVKNPSKPRFFERSRPNQLWQSDIMTFRLAGRNAYLIGFLDDYSRYITSLGLYRSQTAAQVLETYRRGVAEYGVPREMLTDNGRQYTNWRGKTRFEREMKKDRVRHIRSRPHHPMTLGKIERFWKSIQTEFLMRAQFGSFDEAVERCGYWVKYYNYKRPHQGIGGLCPADRFFEIAHDLKRTLEKGVADNTLELALRGRPVDPFYMVGRMGDQSVVIRAEKGKVRMLLDGEEQRPQKELVYDARKDIDDEDSQTTPQDIRSSAENNGRVVDLERAAHERPGLSADGHQPGAAGPVAEPGHRGHAQSAGSYDERPSAAAQSPAHTADRKEAGRPQREIGKAPAPHPDVQTGQRHVVPQPGGDHEKSRSITADRPSAGRGDHEGALRSFDRQPGGPPVGRIPQDLLQVGRAGVKRPFGQLGGPACRPPGTTCGPPSSGLGKAAGPGSAGDRPDAPQDGSKGCAGGTEARSNSGPGEKKMTAFDRSSP